jgi:hypothetical protein
MSLDAFTVAKGNAVLLRFLNDLMRVVHVMVPSVLGMSWGMMSRFFLFLVEVIQHDIQDKAGDDDTRNDVKPLEI